MNYQIGDQVVHWQYGLGKVISIDEMSLAGQTRLYYVVAINQLTIWVPVVEAGESCLHLPTTSAEFKLLLNLLANPGTQLPDHQNERQKELAIRMKHKTLGEICHIICDLNSRSRVQKLNRNDFAVLKRAKALLLVEWEVSFGTPQASALRELDVLLKEHPVPSSAL